MDITVITSSWTATTGTLQIGQLQIDCTLGRGGVTTDKTEGDGKTPVGRFPLRQVFYRADRLPMPETGLPVELLTADTGWCEDVSHPDYNRRVRLPHPSVHDRMTRDDALYDLVIVVGYNDDPPVSGKGSAIFIHLARPEFTPTAGCVGLRLHDLQSVLKLCSRDSFLVVFPPPKSDS